MTKGERVNVYQIITDRIVTQLEKGVIPWRKPWKGTADARLPRNVKGRPYRGINVWLLLSLGYDSPYFMTYKQAQSLGGKVKAGEKGMPVILWQPFEKMAEDKEGVMRPKRFMTLRYYTVFNISQTEGCKFPKAVQASLDVQPSTAPVDEFAGIAAADAIFEGWTGKPTVAYDGNDRAYYVPSLDEIHLPKKASFRSSEGYYSTLFHELGHATGHESRLNRKNANAFGSHAYGTEELVAEMTSSYLSAVAGIEQANLEDNAAYIGAWLKTIKEDVKAVVTAAGQAQKAADLIIGSAVAVEAVESEQESEAA